MDNDFFTNDYFFTPMNTVQLAAWRRSRQNGFMGFFGKRLLLLVVAFGLIDLLIFLAQTMLRGSAGHLDWTWLLAPSLGSPFYVWLEWNQAEKRFRRTVSLVEHGNAGDGRG